MANVKITALSGLAGGDIAEGDVFVIDDISATETKKVTAANVQVFTGNAHSVLANLDAFATTSNTNAAALASGIASVSVDLSIGADSGSDDTVTVGTDTLNIVGADGITTTVSDNQISIDLDDTAVTAGVYGGKIGTVSNVPVITIDAQGRITAASNSEVAVDLSTLEGNVNTVSSNVEARNTQLNANIDLVQDNVATNATDIAAVEARRAANVESDDNNAAAVEARRVANIAGAISTVLTSDLTASRAMVTDSSGKIAIDTQVTATELNYLNGVTSAIQPQISTLTSDQNLILTNLRHFATQANANIDVVSGNVDARHIQLNANIDVVQGNVASIIDGTTAFTGDVTLEDDDGGSSAGPLIILNRQSASPSNADYLGRIQFKGKNDGGSNDTYSQISGKIIDVSAGSEDGAVEISVKKAGSSTIVSRQRSDKLQLLNDTGLTVAGTSEFTGEVTMSDDLVVTGNLTVNGTTVTVASTNLNVTDRMLMLANGATGSPSADVGILFNRGDEGNAAIFYDESAQTFKLSDTKDPSSNTSLSL